MLLASGVSPVYPCHVPAQDMRQHPIGTGPFKFVEFKPNEYIGLTRTPITGNRAGPISTAIELTIIPEPVDQALAFIAGEFDMTFPYGVTVQMMRDIKSQAPNAICEVTSTTVAINMIVNRDSRRSIIPSSAARCR